MIFFYGEGRLGNQIFQYQALSQIARPGERLVSVGLEDLQRCLELRGPKLNVLTRSALLKRIVKYVINPLLLRPLARTLRLLNYGFESSAGTPPHRGAGGELSMRSGLIGSVTFIDGGYYQNSAFWPTLFPAHLFRLHESLRAAARSYLDSICGAGLRPAFVHVRRGDYLTHTDFGLSGLSLPAEFYHEALKELAARAGPRHLVFVTDDPCWVRENFAELSNKSIAAFDADMDFAVMAECAGGILSNSTFCLAAALMLNNPDTVIAPKYWLGFRAGAWYPPRLAYEHPSLTYIEVAA
jgi:hypothetical protein